MFLNLKFSESAELYFYTLFCKKKKKKKPFGFCERVLKVFFLKYKISEKLYVWAD